MLSIAAVAALTLSGASPELEKKARAFVEQLSHGDFKTPQASFTSQMKAALPEDKLAATCRGVTDTYGPLKSVGAATVEQKDGMTTVTLFAQHERGELGVRVVFDAAGKIAGLFFRPAADPAVEAPARQFVDQLRSGDFDGAEKRFDATMSSQMPAAKLAETWKTVLSQAGGLVAVRNVRVEPVAQYQAALVGCRFEKGDFTVKVVFDGARKIAGLFFLPGDLAAPWSPPPYAAADKVHEREVTVGTVKLPGHLTLPNGKGPFPAIVLVHGSGPNDEDESLGPNKVFKDIALGLASRGIVVLRYNKRTRVAPGSGTSIQAEVLDDAGAAIDLLKAQPEVDPKRVAALGHSLGGYLMPWLARDRPNLCGVVMLAGSARPMLELLVEQRAYFVSLHPGNPQAEKGLEEAKAMKARSEAKDLRPDETLFNAPGSYWLSTRDYRPVEVAAALKTPMLVLQGERDYQVQFKTDFAAFAKALKGHPNATLKSYAKLNHLFLAGEGPSTPDEYERLAHVDETAVKDVADWLLKR